MALLRPIHWYYSRADLFSPVGPHLTIYTWPSCRHFVLPQIVFAYLLLSSFSPKAGCGVQNRNLKFHSIFKSDTIFSHWRQRISAFYRKAKGSRPKKDFPIIRLWFCLLVSCWSLGILYNFVCVRVELVSSMCITSHWLVYMSQQWQQPLQKGRYKDDLSWTPFRVSMAGDLAAILPIEKQLLCIPHLSVLSCAIDALACLPTVPLPGKKGTKRVITAFICLPAFLHLHNVHICNMYSLAHICCDAYTHMPGSREQC